jgi:hypothetical protein
MTQEDKELLLKDLCGRLPYHVRVKVWLKDGTTEEGFYDFEHNYEDVMKDFFFYNKLNDLKPYLRSMSSMTEEEKKELLQISNFDSDVDDICYDSICCIERTSIDITDIANFISWLNAHHFDYRGLIEKGLALEAPKDMYN